MAGKNCHPRHQPLDIRPPGRNKPSLQGWRLERHRIYWLLLCTLARLQDC